MRKYLSLQVWSSSEVFGFALAVTSLLVLLVLWPAMRWSAAFAGIAGAVVLRHFSLHGWRLTQGTVAQRLLLSFIWLCSVGIAGCGATGVFGL